MPEALLPSDFTPDVPPGGLHAQAVRRLAELCDRNNEWGITSAPGAKDTEIEEIRETFARLEMPLPTGLLDVYRATLCVPGLTQSYAILAAPIFSNYEHSGHSDMLLTEREDTLETEIVVLGRIDERALVMNRDGRCRIAAIGEERESFADGTGTEEALVAYCRMAEDCVNLFVAAQRED